MSEKTGAGRILKIPLITVRVRPKSRRHWLIGLRKKLSKSGFVITRSKVLYFLSSPDVWLIQTKRAKRAKLEGSRLETLQQEVETNLREAGKGVEGSFQGKTIT